jgi:hypothetical protein
VQERGEGELKECLETCQ